MKQTFLLFAGDEYYPTGGWNDLQGTYDSAAEAVEAVLSLAFIMRYDWWHVVDLGAGTIVKQSKP